MTDQLRGAELVGLAILAVETANVIRRQELAGLVSGDQAPQAHADLLDLAIEQWPYQLVAGRAWELRMDSRRTTRATSRWRSSSMRRWSRSTSGSAERPASGAPSTP